MLTLRNAIERAVRGETAEFSVATRDGSQCRFQIRRLANGRCRVLGDRCGVLRLWHPNSIHGSWGYIFVDGEDRAYIARRDELNQCLRDQLAHLAEDTDARIRCCLAVQFRAEEQGGKWWARNVRKGVGKDNDCVMVVRGS